MSRFQEIMENEFQMSMMGELTFFLGIQVKQMKEGIFIHQAKYMKDLMKKFNKAELKPVSTPMSTAATLDPDENGEAIDLREYRSMIGSLLYLMVTRPDIQFVVCLYICFQPSPRSSHGRQFNKSSGTSNTLLSLGFGILLLLRLILLGFLMLISRGVRLTKRALLLLAIFSNLLLYVGQLASSLLLHSPPQRLSI
jgi:hypothetical protein